MPRDCLSDPEEAIDVWPRGGCWLQAGCRMKHAKSALEGFPKALGEGCQVSSVLRVLSCWLQDEVCQVSAGRVSQSIGGGLPSQQRFKGFKLFKGLERLEGLRAGKRQAWTPRRSHGCVALGCLLAAG